MEIKKKISNFFESLGNKVKNYIPQPLEKEYSLLQKVIGGAVLALIAGVIATAAKTIIKLLFKTALEVAKYSAYTAACIAVAYGVLRVVAPLNEKAKNLEEKLGEIGRTFYNENIVNLFENLSNWFRRNAEQAQNSYQTQMPRNEQQMPFDSPYFQQHQSPNERGYSDVSPRWSSAGSSHAAAYQERRQSGTSETIYPSAK